MHIHVRISMSVCTYIYALADQAGLCLLKGAVDHRTFEGSSTTHVRIRKGCFGGSKFKGGRHGAARVLIVVSQAFYIQGCA